MSRETGRGGAARETCRICARSARYARIVPNDVSPGEVAKLVLRRGNCRRSPEMRARTRTTRGREPRRAQRRRLDPLPTARRQECRTHLVPISRGTTITTRRISACDSRSCQRILITTPMQRLEGSRGTSDARRLSLPRPSPSPVPRKMLRHYGPIRARRRKEEMTVRDNCEASTTARHCAPSRGGTTRDGARIYWASPLTARHAVKVSRACVFVHVGTRISERSRRAERLISTIKVIRLRYRFVPSAVCMRAYVCARARHASRRTVRNILRAVT